MSEYGRDCLLKEAISFKMEEEKLEKTWVKRDLAMKAMVESAADLERTANHVNTKRSLLKETDKDFISCLSHTNISGS